MPGMERSTRYLHLDDGEVVSMTSLRQWEVYAGLLEGLPTRERNDATLARLVADSERSLGYPPYLVTPTQTPIAYAGKYPFGDPARLPRIACVARLQSGPRGRRDEEDYTELTVIWFQEEFAFPMSEDAARAIRGIDWARQAWGFSH